jgi:hypothetical protein
MIQVLRCVVFVLCCIVLCFVLLCCVLVCCDVVRALPCVALCSLSCSVLFGHVCYYFSTYGSDPFRRQQLKQDEVVSIFYFLSHWG